MSPTAVLSNPSIGMAPVSVLWNLQLERGHSEVFMFLR